MATLDMRDGRAETGATEAVQTQAFGGAGTVHNKAVRSKKKPLHGFEQSITITLPPMSVLYFEVPAKRTRKTAEEKAAEKAAPKKASKTAKAKKAEEKAPAKRGRKPKAAKE